MSFSSGSKLRRKQNMASHRKPLRKTRWKLEKSIENTHIYRATDDHKPAAYACKVSPRNITQGREPIRDCELTPYQHTSSAYPIILGIPYLIEITGNENIM